ncbi:heme-binding domain-containing protein, partial [Acinetobacter baumannii]
MKGRVKNVLLVLIALVILMQFYQPAVNKTVTTADNVDFITMYSPPADVAETLRMSCFDCHSNNTNYRWYDYIQPARTLVESHIQSAK